MATSVNAFTFIPIGDRAMYHTAFDAITQLELWQYMANFHGESFMFSRAPEITRISQRICALGYTGHSGASFGCTMRAMEYIAKNGFDAFKIAYTAGN
jgi:hypothetical protein